MMKWLRWVGMGLAGILVAVGFAMLGRPKRRQRKAEAQRDQLIFEGSDKARVKAKKLGKLADKHQAHAKEAKVAGQAAIDKVGAENEDMASLLDSWRSEPDSV